MSLEERMKSAFGSAPNSDYANDYLAEVRTNWRDAERDLRRAVSLIIILAIIFELISRGGVAEFTFTFVKLTEPGVIATFLPVAIAYFATTVSSLTIQSSVLRTIHDNVINTVYEPISANNLEYPLYPGNATFYVHQTALAANVRGQFLPNLGFSRLITILLIPLVFEIYAFAKLFSLHGARYFTVWISLAVSGLFIAVAIATFMTGYRALDIQR